MAAKIKRGDRVVVLAGKSRGTEGTVLRVFPKEQRVLVDGVNMAQRHTKPSQADPQGGIKNKEMPIHVSNVAIATADGASRVGFRMEGDKKVRFAKKSGETIDV